MSTGRRMVVIAGLLSVIALGALFATFMWTTRWSGSVAPPALTWESREKPRSISMTR